MLTNDGGNTGSGGALSDSDNSTITVVAAPIVDLNSGPTVTTTFPGTVSNTSVTSNLVTNGTFASGTTGWMVSDPNGVAGVSNGRYDWIGCGRPPTLTQSITVPAGSSVNTSVTTNTATTSTTTNSHRRHHQRHHVDFIRYGLAEPDTSSPNDNRLIISYNGTNSPGSRQLRATPQDGAGLLGTWTYASGVSGPAASATPSIGNDETTDTMSTVTLTFATAITASGALVQLYRRLDRCRLGRPRHRQCHRNEHGHHHDDGHFRRCHGVGYGRQQLDRQLHRRWLRSLYRRHRQFHLRQQRHQHRECDHRPDQRVGG